jgi:hypothetical protein
MRLRALLGMTAVVTTVFLLLAFAGIRLAFAAIALAAAAGYGSAVLAGLTVPTWSVFTVAALEVMVLAAAFSRYEDDSCCDHTLDVLLFVSLRLLPLTLAAITGIAVGSRRTSARDER